MMNFRIFDSVEDLVKAAAQTIVQRVAGRERATVALSGGSTPVPVYELLGSRYRSELAKTRILWIVVDERYVPIDDPQSNAGMIQRTLFREGMSEGHDFFRFKTELNDPAKTAREFEAEWTRRGLQSLDTVLLGVGDDGHTASLFPGTPVLQVTDRVAAEVFVPRLNQWRVTLTLPVIREAEYRMILATGGSKRRIIEDVQKSVPHPITLLHTVEVENWWFVDRAAAPVDSAAPRN